MSLNLVTQVCEEMIFVVGRGSGAENLARSTRRAAANGVAVAAARNGTNGDASDSEEEESGGEQEESEEEGLPAAKRGRGGGRGVAGARPGPLKCFCASPHQIFAKSASQNARNRDKADFTTKVRKLRIN